MRIFKPSHAVRASALILVSATLGGCGGSAPAAVAQNPEQIVFTAASDCAATGKIKPAQCSQAIEAALNQHLAGSPVYRSLALCETTEGTEKCERMDAKSYRPRLAAMIASVAAAEQAEATGTPLAATPLYPTQAGELGFRMLDKSVILIDGENLVFSPQAIAAAELSSVVATP